MLLLTPRTDNALPEVGMREQDFIRFLGGRFLGLMVALLFPSELLAQTSSCDGLGGLPETEYSANRVWYLHAPSSL